MDLLSASSRNVPKMSSPTLDIKNNYYLVKTGLLYNYYPIKVKPFTEDDNIIWFEKTPPVLMEGIVIVGKKPYHVTTQDLMRGVIRKSRAVAVAKREKVDGKSESVTSIKSLRQTLQHPDEQRVSREASVEILEDANAAWEEQIGALLDSFAAKEGDEYEISDSA